MNPCILCKSLSFSPCRILMRQILETKNSPSGTFDIFPIGCAPPSSLIEQSYRKFCVYLYLYLHVLCTCLIFHLLTSIKPIWSLQLGNIAFANYVSSTSFRLATRQSDLLTTFLLFLKTKLTYLNYGTYGLNLIEFLKNILEI